MTASWPSSAASSLLFALLIVARLVHRRAARLRRRLLRTTASVISPLVNGWSLEERAATSAAPGDLVPPRQRTRCACCSASRRWPSACCRCLSLLGATPGLGRAAPARPAPRSAWRRLFALDLLVLLLYPWLVGIAQRRHRHRRHLPRPAHLRRRPGDPLVRPHLRPPARRLGAGRQAALNPVTQSGKTA